MRNITKGPEPRSLEEYRCTPDAYWDGYRGKKEAFAALCREQGYLCAYCMSRIKPDQTPHKIEHWISQKPFKNSDSPSVHEDHALRWSNLLGVCPGGAKRESSGKSDDTLPSASSPAGKTSHSRKDPRHCDTYRGNRPLAIDPASDLRPLKDLFKYSNDGRIYSDNPSAQQDIEALNLNVWRLRENRFGVLKRLRKELGVRTQWTRSLLRRQLAGWEQPIAKIEYKDAKGQLQTDRGYREYNQVAVSFLERQLKKRPD